MRIVFMGTPEFAVPSLEALYGAGHDILCVFTQPDRPQDRGMTPKFPPVKEYAAARGTVVHQPEKLKNAETVGLIKSYAPELIAVVAYGQILPEEILSCPEHGCINVHASLLPKYRGAAPIQWSVINGEHETGITTMLMAKGLDTGDMIFRESTKILPDETAGELHDRLKFMGAELLKKTVSAISQGSFPKIPQNNEKSSYAPVLKKDICPIDWNSGALDIKNKIRGLNPWPVATMTLNGKTVRVFSSHVTDEITDLKPGSIFGSFEEGIKIACGDGKVICITELQAGGGRRMSASEYLRGHPISGGRN